MRKSVVLVLALGTFLSGVALVVWQSEHDLAAEQARRARLEALSR